jgi:hypothetical protein
MIKIFCLALLIMTGMSCKTQKQAAIEGNAERQVFAGEFMYFADAPVFRPCGHQQIYPVVMDKAYIEAERQYLNMTEGGTWVYITFSGIIVEKKNEEGRPVNMFLIEKLKSMDKNKRCDKK